LTAIFITATASDVGKTFVAASLIRHLRDMGRQVDAIKPIVEGYDSAQAAASDPGVLLAALGVPLSPEAVDRISPWRFRAAISPELAARQEHRGIDVEQVLAYCESVIERRRDILLIEGVGGIMVPLDQERTMLDVMMALRLPLILVTGSYPAAISHTLTALDSLFRREMSVIATIVSETPGSAVPLEDVVATIARYIEPVIGVPRQPRHGAPEGSVFGSLFGPKGRR
jgi:dethiobiotin synthetase